VSTISACKQLFTADGGHPNSSRGSASCPTELLPSARGAMEVAERLILRDRRIVDGI
jgi:hypothetical protein